MAVVRIDELMGAGFSEGAVDCVPDTSERRRQLDVLDAELC